MTGILCIYEQEEVVTFFEFLDDLRESGVTNMMGASSYLVEEFGFAKDRAQKVLSLWMESFDSKVPVKRRAELCYMVHGQP